MASQLKQHRDVLALGRSVSINNRKSSGLRLKTVFLMYFAMICLKLDLGHGKYASTTFDLLLSSWGV